MKNPFNRLWRVFSNQPVHYNATMGRRQQQEHLNLCYFYTDISMNGGIERVISLLAGEQVEKLGYNVTIVSMFRSSKLLPYDFSDKINFVYLSDEPYRGAPGSLRRLKLQLKSLFLIKKHFRKHKYDVIAAQSFPCAFMAYLAIHRKQTIIAVEHVYHDYYGAHVQKLRNYIYRRLNGVVVLTDNDRDAFVAKVGKVEVIPNPIVFNDNVPAILNSTKIITVGRLEHQKGYDNLIKIFRKVHKAHPEWTLHIYGKGTQKDMLQSMIEQYGMIGAVVLEGVSDVIAEKFRDSAFCVVSSRFEGFPMVITEAMREGVPCISFRCPNGPESIITHGVDGLLVENQNKDAMADAIINLIEDAELRHKLGLEAFRSIRQFDVHTVAMKWDEYYKTILNV